MNYKTKLNKFYSGEVEFLMNRRQWELKKTILLTTEIWCIFNFFNKILGIQISFIFSTGDSDDEWDNQGKNNFVLDLIDKKESSSGIKTSSLAKISQVKNKSLTKNAQVRGVNYALKINI